MFRFLKMKHFAINTPQNTPPCFKQNYPSILDTFLKPFWKVLFYVCLQLGRDYQGVWSQFRMFIFHGYFDVGEEPGVPGSSSRSWEWDERDHTVMFYTSAFSLEGSLYCLLFSVQTPTKEDLQSCLRNQRKGVSDQWEGFEGN